MIEFGTVATETLADLGVEIDYQTDNSIILKKGWFLTVTISAADAEALYQFIKAQRKHQGLAT